MRSAKAALSSVVVCAAASTLINLLAVTSAAAQNLVQNGDFSTFSTAGTSVAATGGNGQLGYNTNLASWTAATNSYNFVYKPYTIDKTGTTGNSGTVYMWGPNNGSNNGLTGAAPMGGNIIAADGAYDVGAISQTITGLTVGKTYVVSFYWAGAQQYNFTGANTEQWKVTFGSQEQDTAVFQNTSGGFTGWQQQSFSYVATATSQVLSFLSNGTPTGQPPFSLLANVSVNAAPEPGVTGLLLTGLATGAMFLRKRKRL